MIISNQIPILEYDDCSPEVIQPDHDWAAEILPEKCLFAFLGDIVHKYAVTHNARVAETLITVSHDTGKDAIRIYIGGYSLAGFFALWAAYRTSEFRGAAAVSPSVWFPGWMEYAENNTVKAETVYLSLGDKEEKTRNPVMRTVGDNIRRQYEILKSDPGCSRCVLEMNRGNHFREPDIRTAKGFAWLLNNKEKSL